MKSHILSAALVCAITVPLQAGLITNGGFESGFTGWVRTDQTGSEGTFLLPERRDKSESVAARTCAAGRLERSDD